MSGRVVHETGAAPMRALLSPFGIGMSKHVNLSHSAVNRKHKGEELSMTVSSNVGAGTPLLVLADAAMLTCQAALDADVDGLAPPPAEMLEMLHDDTAQLDEMYLAYYLSQRYYTKPNDWYAHQLDLCSTARSNSIDVRPACALWERAAREYVSAPQSVFLAALRYVRASSFFKPAAAAVDAGAPSPPAALAVAPVLDVLLRNGGKANVSLMACTAKDVAEKYLSEDLRGVRQALLSKDDACAYWALLARGDLPVGSTVSVSSQNLFT
ncbi:hypothetical protein ABB37_00780 [Leptomonas pyrrhocoris]|uniref:Uncharacterized protein n=1 Tax=Leptomonas pyrrhocoris TaxID=157538 RepID=A0A0N0E0P3_LEPPY|nr:hypothetical protein ABB37_00780 [Leptomonas pyrrhocoris]XP_015665122.1 hypothetical protein ABB37_00780 [Leptomonas pyrrhocoris]KPA86682.1 hypothetical protein ABB37_00780 [Leptomonas pyrrhocoris]KPA86683.1 hypothetical protein ABB37_00780 [Leptomonas pyrrhocoris]|eukprot:XP_015665121.1 hypothetical protein ABB37_00780 [Leptomonas pyrrhocoris]